MRIFKLNRGVSVRADEISISELPKNTIYALGCFDGIHPGHRALIDCTSLLSRETGSHAGVWCLSASGKSGALCSDSDRLALFADAGISYAVFEDFSAVCNMSAEDFVIGYLKNTLGSSGAVCGFNFRFSKKRAAGTRELQELCKSGKMSCRVVNAVEIEGSPVSSSRIRAAIEAGDAGLARRLLGRPYSFESVIIEGKRLGRKIGIPTVNQKIPRGMTVPRRGIYIACCTVDGVCRKAITNIGLRPTVEDADDILCESHILDFDEDVYGTIVRTELLDWRREERRFSSVEELRDTILRDVDARRMYDRD